MSGPKIIHAQSGGQIAEAVVQPESPRAFPSSAIDDRFGGMELRDWFAGQALNFSNDSYPEWQIRAWFGDRTGITREEIRAKAAYACADAMLAEREKGGAQ